MLRVPPWQISPATSSSMQVVAGLLESSRGSGDDDRAAKRQQLWPTLCHIFLSPAAINGRSIWPCFSDCGVIIRRSSTVRILTPRFPPQSSAAFSVELPAKIFTTALEPALNVYALSPKVFSTNAADTARLVGPIVVYAGWLDVQDCGFFGSPDILRCASRSERRSYFSLV